MPVGVIAAARRRNSAADPHWANVVFLSGWDASAVDDCTDDSASGHDIRWGGGAGLFTSTTAKFGARSLRRNPSGSGNDFAHAGVNTAHDFESGPFTLETWVRFVDAPVAGVHVLFSKYNTGSNQRSWSFQLGSGSLQLLLASSGAVAGVGRASAAWAPSTGTWYHAAADFDGTDYRTYVDGVMLGKQAGTVALFAGTARLAFGVQTSGSSSIAGPFNGYLDETRITKGVARYASDAGFTPPTAAFPRS